MASNPRGPNPDPPHPVCNNNCGAVFSEGKSREEITCPCGYGYFREDGIFVPGSLVRNNRAPSREEYKKHVRACSDRRKGPPIVGRVLLEPVEGPGSTCLYVQSPPQALIQPRPTERMRAERFKDRDSSSRTKHTDQLPLRGRNASQEQPLFIPDEEIEEEALRESLQHLGYEGFQIGQDQTQGWLVYGINARAVEEWHIQEIVYRAQKLTQRSKEEGYNRPGDRNHVTTYGSRSSDLHLQNPLEIFQYPEASSRQDPRRTERRIDPRPANTISATTETRRGERNPPKRNTEPRRDLEPQYREPHNSRQQRTYSEVLTGEQRRSVDRLGSKRTMYPADYPDDPYSAEGQER